MSTKKTPKKKISIPLSHAETVLQHRIRRHEHQRRREQVPRQAGRARHRRRGLLWRTGEQANPEPTPVAVGAVGGSCCRASRRSPPRQPLQSLALAAPPSDGCPSMRARAAATASIWRRRPPPHKHSRSQSMLTTETPSAAQGRCRRRSRRPHRVGPPQRDQQ